MRIEAQRNSYHRWTGLDKCLPPKVSKQKVSELNPVVTLCIIVFVGKNEQLSLLSTCCWSKPLNKGVWHLSFESHSAFHNRVYEINVGFSWWHPTFESGNRAVVGSQRYCFYSPCFGTMPRQKRTYHHHIFLLNWYRLNSRSSWPSFRTNSHLFISRRYIFWKCKTQDSTTPQHHHLSAKGFQMTSIKAKESSVLKRFFANFEKNQIHQITIPGIPPPLTLASVIQREPTYH